MHRPYFKEINRKVDSHSGIVQRIVSLKTLKNNTVYLSAVATCFPVTSLKNKLKQTHFLRNARTFSETPVKETSAFAIRCY